LWKRDGNTVLEGSLHGGAVVRLHADELHLGPERTHHAGDAGRQAASAYGDEQCLERVRVLAQHLEPDGPLTCDHVLVVEGMDERGPRLSLQAPCVAVGLV